MKDGRTKPIRIAVDSGDDAFVSGFRSFVDDPERGMAMIPVTGGGTIGAEVDIAEIDCVVRGPDASAVDGVLDRVDDSRDELDVPVVAAVGDDAAIGDADVVVAIGDEEPRFDRIVAHVRAAVGADDGASASNRDTSTPDRNVSASDRDLYEAILESIDDAVYAIRADGTIVYVNDRYARMKGTDRDSLIGTDIYELVSDATAERARREREALERRESDVGVIEYEFTPVEGESFPAEMRFATVDESCEADRVGVIRDISARQEREDLLRQKNERLEEFTGIVSHDLRSPLNVAMGRIQLAREECDSAHLADVENALDRMDSLIEGLLLLAREGESIGDREPIDLASLVRESLGSVDLAGDRVSIESDRTVSADRDRLRQLLENLLRNAVDHGGAGVNVVVGDLHDGFYVADDGPGIPPENRETLFDAGVSTSSDGTGFGLAIVAQIVEAHGWDIAVSDGDGARFEITGLDPK